MDPIENNEATQSGGPVVINKTQPKRKHPGSFNRKNRFSKKPRFTGKDLVSYSANPLPPPGLSTTARQSVYQIHTGTIGILPMVELLYNTLVSRDSKIESQFSSDQLFYVFSICMLYRIYSVGKSYGVVLSHELSKLKDLAESIYLPEALAKAVECVGAINLVHGITVIPYVPSIKELFVTQTAFGDLEALRFSLNPAVDRLLHVVRGRVLYNDDTNWKAVFKLAFHEDIVLNYSSKVSRGMKGQHFFRVCEYGVVEGRPEFMAAYKDDVAEGRRVPLALTVMEEVHAQLGACYGFRNEEDREHWLGKDVDNLPYLHIGNSFLARTFWLKNVMSAIAPSNNR